jgi:hypothetical protein
MATINTISFFFSTLVHIKANAKEPRLSFHQNRLLSTLTLFEEHRDNPLDVLHFVLDF